MNLFLKLFIVILLYTIMGLTKTENYTDSQNELASDDESFGPSGKDCHY